MLTTVKCEGRKSSAIEIKSVNQISQLKKKFPLFEPFIFKAAAERKRKFIENILETPVSLPTTASVNHYVRHLRKRRLTFS